MQGDSVEVAAAAAVELIQWRRRLMRSALSYPVHSVAVLSIRPLYVVRRHNHIVFTRITSPSVISNTTAGGAGPRPGQLASNGGGIGLLRATTSGE